MIRSRVNVGEVGENPVEGPVPFKMDSEAPPAFSGKNLLQNKDSRFALGDLSNTVKKGPPVSIFGGKDALPPIETMNMKRLDNEGPYSSDEELRGWSLRQPVSDDDEVVAALPQDDSDLPPIEIPLDAAAFPSLQDSIQFRHQNQIEELEEEEEEEMDYPQIEEMYIPDARFDALDYLNSLPTEEERAFRRAIRSDPREDPDYFDYDAFYASIPKEPESPIILEAVEYPKWEDFCNEAGDSTEAAEA